MSDGKTLWGIPIVESHAIPKGVTILGPLPTFEEMRQFGSLEQWIKANAKRLGVVKNLESHGIRVQLATSNTAEIE